MPLFKKESEDAVLKLLSEHGEMSTKEVEDAVAEMGVKCSETIVRLLKKLQYEGKVEGGISREKRGWGWWLPKADDKGGDEP